MKSLFTIAVEAVAYSATRPLHFYRGYRTLLATIRADGIPQQSVVWYELQGNVVMMNTRKGRVKDRNIRRDPRVSLCIDNGYRYVAISGHVTLFDDQTVAQADIKRLAVRYHGAERAEAQMRDQFSKEERVTVHLAIEHVHEYGLSE